MVKRVLNEDDVLGSSGIADPRLADHSGDIQHGYELGSLTRGLVGYWPMEEGQGQVAHDGALDAIGNFTSSPTWVAGQVGSNALDFDGSTDLVEVTTPTITGQSFTMACWVNADAINRTNSQHIFRNATTDPAHIEETSGNWQFRIFNQADSTNYSVSSTATTNAWVHLVGVFNDGILRLYVDGNSAGSTNAGITFDGEDDGVYSSIGARYNDVNFFDGTVDDARIYDRALSQPEVEVLYNLASSSGQLIDERDLLTYPNPVALARYEFENNVQDSWGDNDGINNTSAGFTDGVYGQAKDFDGTDDQVECGQLEEINGVPKLTMSGWVNADTLPTTGVQDSHGLFGKGEGGNELANILWQADNNEWQFEIRDRYANYHAINSAYKDNINEWHHLCGVFDRGAMYFYIDGRLVDSADVSANTLNTNSVQFIIGDKGTNGWYFDGQIDDVRVYTDALSAIEVETLFNKGAYRIRRGDVV